MKSYQSKRFKKNKIQNPAITALKEKDASKNVNINKEPETTNNITTESNNSSVEIAKSRAIIVISFSLLGFIFAFTANYGFFDMAKAFSSGIVGFVGGAILGLLPYYISSKA